MRLSLCTVSFTAFINKSATCDLICTAQIVDDYWTKERIHKSFHGIELRDLGDLLLSSCQKHSRRANEFVLSSAIHVYLSSVPWTLVSLTPVWTEVFYELTQPFILCT